MFCSKCGSQISSTDKYCSKCGALNSNYVEAKEANSKIKVKENLRILRSPIRSIPKKLVAGGIATFIAFAVVIVCFLVFKNNTNDISVHHDKINYSPSGLVSYIDGEGNANLFIDNDLVTLQGPIQMAETSPDHENWFAITEEEKLLLYSAENKDGVEIDSNVTSIRAINDECIYYTVGNPWHLFMYDFAKGEITDIGFENGQFFSPQEKILSSV